MRLLALLVGLLLLGVAHVARAELVANDEAALKFALALKRAQLGHFEAGLHNNTMQDFINVGYNVTIYQYLVIIQGQIQAQADNISALLSQAGAAPLAECTYATANDTEPEAFLVEARNLCNVVVSSVSGLLAYVADTDALTLLASGHSVAGRHCAYLNLISGLLPFPAAHESVASLQATQSALAPYIDSCPYTLVLPTARRAASAAAHVALAAALLLLPALHLLL